MHGVPGARFYRIDGRAMPDVWRRRMDQPRSIDASEAGCHWETFGWQVMIIVDLIGESEHALKQALRRIIEDK
jgi:hypothetical protein